LKNTRNYWTKEKCKEEALKYNTKEEFREKSRYAYTKSFKQGWLKDFCVHMKKSERIPRGYWTKEKCKEESLKYDRRIDFENNCRSAYVSCVRNGWLDYVYSHMSGKGYKSHGYWTKENCQKESLKYSTRNEFRKKSSWPYRISLKNNWLDDICSHMSIIGNLFKRCIYAYEFEDNYVYVGLTFNLEKRNVAHFKKKSPVYKHNLLTSGYTLIQLTEYTDVDKAKELEKFFVEEYKSNGWLILNRIKTGGIGGSFKWTKEKCHTEALKYKSRKDFSDNDKGAYSAARRYNCLNEICEHMIQKQKPSGYWTKEKCQEIALKYTRRRDFSKNDRTVYDTSLRNGWLEDICSHMEKIKDRKPKDYWTKERCQEIALKYNNLKDFVEYDRSAYSIILGKGWSNELLSHIIRKNIINVKHWTKEKCQEESLKYSTRNEFKKNSSTAYTAALKHKWIDDICSHMIEGKKPNGYWTKERCKEESLKYNHKSEFCKNSGVAYKKCCDNGWLKELCSHMK